VTKATCEKCRKPFTPSEKAPAYELCSRMSPDGTAGEFWGKCPECSKNEKLDEFFDKARNMGVDTGGG
jgi:endogenous inhibitor of DNA gyrase (YacG/DUF329 family)